MTSSIITTDTIVGVGPAVELTGFIDSLYVAANTTLAAIGIGQRGVLGSNDGQTINVAGDIYGATGIEYTAGSSSINIYAGGAVTGSFVAMEFTGNAMTVQNAGSISGFRGIFSNCDIRVVNSGSIFGDTDAIFALSDATVINTGTVLASGTAVYVAGLAMISNYGMIVGEVISQGFDDTLINRGTITGTVQIGAGNDLVDGIGGRFEKSVSLGAGNDTFWGGAATDIIRGDAGNDDIDGGAGNDRVIVGNADGFDSYDGGVGIDLIDARLMTTAVALNLTLAEARNGAFVDSVVGFEWAYGGAGSDRIAGDTAANLLRGAAGNDVLAGLDGNDWLFGDGANDSLTGGNGNDRLFGGDGVDTLSGGAGADQLTGSYDIDLMSGGTEADRFIFTDLDEFFPVTGTGLDRITDFQNAVDQIDLSALDARFNLAGDQAFSFIGIAAITAFGQLNYRFLNGNTIISIGLNTASALDVIRLDGLHTMTAADFIL